MPKEHFDPNGSESSAKKKPDKPARVRNKSCLECDAVHPVCGTCLRSYNHVLQHLPADQEPPPYPHCTFEEGYDFSSPSTTRAVGHAATGPRRGKVGQLENRISQLEGMLKVSATPDGSEAYEEGNRSTSSGTGLGSFSGGRGGGAGGGRGGDASGHGRTSSGTDDWRGVGVEPSPLGPNYPIPGQEFSNLSLNQQPYGSDLKNPPSNNNPPLPHYLSNPNLPPNLFPSNSFQPEGPNSPFPSLSPYLQQQPNGSQWYSLPSSSTSSFNSNVNGTSSFPPTPANNSSPWSYPNPNSSSSGNPPLQPQQIYDTFPPEFHDTFPPSRPPPTTFTSPEPMEQPALRWQPSSSSHPQRQSSGARVEEFVEEEPSWAGGAGSMNEPSQVFGQPPMVQNGVLDIPEIEDEYLLQLLWPGWPPHLPSPGKLEHIVQVFFNKVPFATELLNRPRFLSRLALPPVHKDFPHPALLHAICACTARYLPDIQLVPAEAVFRPITFSDKRNEFEPEQLPCWNGFGPKPANTTRLIDEDFAEIHHRWGSLYVEKGKTNAGEWYALVQAMFLLAQYAHQHSLWVVGWLHMSLMGRFVIPLGLNARPYHAQTILSVSRDLLLPPASDDVERLERANLFWLVFCQDTYSSTASGWQGILDGHDLFLGLPTCHSTYPADTIPEFPTQFGDDDDIFTRHSPEQTAFSLDVKGTLLLQKVARFVRRSEMKGEGDPRQTEGFRSLDKLITTFRTSFPADLRDPLKCVTAGGKAVDRNLVVAHTLPFVAIITLHDPFCDFHDPRDQSSPRMLAAARALLGQIYLVNSTTFSFSLLHPFMSYAWFIGARTLAKHVQVAMANGDHLMEKSLREEIAVMRHAIVQVAGTLPIGARQAAILDQIMLDLQVNLLNRKIFPVNNHGLIFSALSIPEATLSPSSSPSNTNSTPTHSAGGRSRTAKEGGGGGSMDATSSSAGSDQPQAQTGGWTMGNGGANGVCGDSSDRMMMEMDTLQAPWEARPNNNSTSTTNQTFL
ncbi:hypothetical protein BDY24DRAFT_379179, partial [Mrakia frigida]|uniref:fungal specific transcription factor domain-containing protein n=1 Tax=Mrakia frigida TaxID=29902 RepID=UPI003FCC0963